MPTKEEVIRKLEMIMVPGVERNLIKMNLISDISVNDGKIDINLATTALTIESQEQLKERIKAAISDFPEEKEVKVKYVDGDPKDLNEIKQVIAIMSGKGGVGKSLVASLAAVILERQGYNVGILDADITGPSIPKMFGINTRPTGSESGMLPVTSSKGIELMSVNLLLPNTDDAVIWRGPLIGNMITQFWEEVLWGKLDYLIVDLPPGTADAPLTVLQTLPVSGIIIVFTPQDLTAMVVRKAVNMAQLMEKPVIGVIENMSYFYVPEIDKKIELFGPSRGDEMAKAAGAPLLGKLPIDPELVELCDTGKIENYENEMITEFGELLNQAMEQIKIQKTAKNK